MQRLTLTMLLIGLADIASAHTLDGSHSTTEAIQHQILGGHHLLFTAAVLAGGVAIYSLGRWLEKHRP
jgi:hypothetical protein